MKKQIIGYPEGNILKVSEEQFNELVNLDLVSFDEEWTEEKPQGQWGFNNSDESKIQKILKQF